METDKDQHLVEPGPTQEMTYLGITYNTKEGTIKVRQILRSTIIMSSLRTPQVGDTMLQRLKTALKMAEGKEELTRKEMTELKWSIYFVNCYPENSNAVDEALDVASRGNHEGAIMISDSVKQEIKKWKEWDGIHKIFYDD